MLIPVLPGWAAVTLGHGTSSLGSDGLDHLCLWRSRAPSLDAPILGRGRGEICRPVLVLSIRYHGLIVTFQLLWQVMTAEAFFDLC
jgi:hypothetical protein